jgi:hypothetical protein
VSLPHSKSNGGLSDGQNRGKTNPSTWKELESGPDRIGGQDQDLVCNRIWGLGCFGIEKSVLSDYTCLHFTESLGNDL